MYSQEGQIATVHDGSREICEPQASSGEKILTQVIKEIEMNLEMNCLIYDRNICNVLEGPVLG